MFRQAPKTSKSLESASWLDAAPHAFLLLFHLLYLQTLQHILHLLQGWAD